MPTSLGQPIPPYTVHKAVLGPGRTALIAEDSAGKFLVGVATNPKPGSGWFTRPITTTDRRRVASAMTDLYHGAS